MKRFQQLLASRAALKTEAEALLNGATDLTAEQSARLDAIESELGDVNAKIEQEQRLRAALLAEPIAPPAVETAPVRAERVHDRELDRPWGFATFGASMEDFCARQPAYRLPPGHALDPQTRYLNAAAGEFLIAVFKAAKGLGTDPRLLYQAAAQGAGEFVGADGGYLVPREQADRIQLRMTGGEVLSRVNRNLLTNGNSIDINVVNETSRATGSRFGAVQGYRIGEGDAITASRPKFAQLSWKLKKYAALGYASDELLADASLMGRLIFDAFGEELRFMAEDDIYNGTGAGAPQGLMIAASTVSIAKETGQAAATFLYENAVKMRARLHARNRANAVWLINQDVEPQLLTMNLAVGTGGAPIFLPPSGAAGSPNGRLLGIPIVPIEYAATCGTVGDVMLVDLSQYWWFDKGDPQQASSMHVAFTTDEQAFRVIYRADGRSSWVDKLTPYKGGSNTQSFAVTCATRS